MGFLVLDNIYFMVFFSFFLKADDDREVSPLNKKKDQASGVYVSGERSQDIL